MTNPEGDLLRKYGLVTATCIVIANMIGSGIFTTSGILAAKLPSAFWVMLCWFLGGLIALAGAMSYSELSTRIPKAGGEYVYLKELFHPSLGFLTGWTSFLVGFSVPIALSALGFTEYLFSGLKYQFAEFDPMLLGWYKKLFAIIIIASFTALHYVGHVLGARVQNILTFFKFVSLFLLVIFGIYAGVSNGGHLSLDLGSSVGGFSFGTAMIIVMYSYSGWNASTYIAGEVKRPKITLPVSLALGTGLVTIIYILVNVFIFVAAPYDELKGSITVAEVASTRAFGNWVSHLLNGFFGIAMLSSLGAYLLIGPRVYYAMAKDRLFFPFADKLHPKFGVPSMAVLFQGMIAVVMIIVGSFEQLLVYVGFALGIFPFLAVVGMFKARRLKIGEDIVVKTRGYPFVPLFYLVTTLMLMIIAFFERPVESSFAIGTVLFGLPVYYFWIKGMGESPGLKK